MLSKFGLTSFVIIGLFACQMQDSQSNNSINGVWESVGSGWILKIQDSTHYSFYDITSISCLPSRQGQLHEISNSLAIQKDTLSLLLGAISYTFSRVDKLPELCSATSIHQKAHDPLYNFEVFAETVKEHYAFMKLNNINWDDLYNLQKKNYHLKALT